MKGYKMIDVKRRRIVVGVSSPTTIKSKRAESLDKSPFMQYIDKYIDRVFHTFHVSFINMPLSTHNLDARFFKSDIINNSIVENLRYDY